MAYDVKFIKEISHSLYLFDTSLWLKILKPPFTTLSKTDQRYLEFFEKFKNDPKKPKVAMTTLILSEIINRWVRDYGMLRYLDENPDEAKKYVAGTDYFRKTYFKIYYRPSNHYKQTLNSICEDLQNFESLTECIHDEFGCEIMLQGALSMLSDKLDFNDNYFVQLAKAKNIPIVSHDKDFFVEDVTVLTFNQDLIDKAKSKVVPKGNVTSVKEIMAAAAAAKND